MPLPEGDFQNVSPLLIPVLEEALRNSTINFPLILTCPPIILINISSKSAMKFTWQNYTSDYDLLLIILKVDAANDLLGVSLVP
jgi:hypothetical protein